MGRSTREAGGAGRVGGRVKNWIGTFTLGLLVVAILGAGYVALYLSLRGY